MKYCDGSNGKAEDSGLKGPGFKPGMSQEKIEKVFSLSFGWLLWNLWDPPLYVFLIAAKTCDNK